MSQHLKISGDAVAVFSSSSATILQWDPSVHPGVSRNIRSVLQGGRGPASDPYFLPAEWVF